MPQARSFGRFALVGVANTVFSFSFFPLLYWLAHERLSFDLILVISYIICHTVPFVTHRYVTFQSTGRLAVEIGRYALVAVATYGANKLLLWVLADRLSPSLLVTQLAISALLLVPSFLLFDRIVFARGRTAPGIFGLSDWD